MQHITRKLSLLTLACGLFTGLGAQSFEGVIDFTKSTGPVVTTYRYFVKGEHVRIEEISARGEVQGIMLVDTRDRTVPALRRERCSPACAPPWRPPSEPI